MCAHLIDFLKGPLGSVKGAGEAERQISSVVTTYPVQPASSRMEEPSTGAWERPPQSLCLVVKFIVVPGIS